MNYKIERTEQYAHIQPKEDFLTESNVADLEKIVRELYRQGYTNMILNFSGINELDGYGVSLIRKATKICVNESGLFVVVTKNIEITERLDNAKIEEVTIMRTPEEAVDAISLNELENDFRQEEDEFGFGEFSEGGGEEDY
jgi:anti-anti-sigma regulatory factor